jgi:hypothetical protein
MPNSSDIITALEDLLKIYRAAMANPEGFKVAQNSRGNSIAQHPALNHLHETERDLTSKAQTLSIDFETIRGHLKAFGVDDSALA